MDHAGCVLWPLSKLLGRRAFKLMSDRSLVTCTVFDNNLKQEYLIARVLYANMKNPDDTTREHKRKPWWLTSDDLPRGDPEIMFIPGPVLDSADGECSGPMYELSGQEIYKTRLFEFWSGYISSLVNSGRLSILYEIASDDKGMIRQVKSRKETFDSVVMSFIYMWRLGHQISLGNPSLLDIFSVVVPGDLIDSLSEYHTLLARGNNSFPKLVPLTKAEIMRPYDITLKFWRECELLRVSTDLCYMYLGTGMPLMSVVCPVYGMTKEKYKNINMVRKFNLSDRLQSDILEARHIVESSTIVPQDIQKLANMNIDEYTMSGISGLIIMPYSGQSISSVLTGHQGSIIRDSFLWSLRERLLDPLVFKQLYMNWLITLTNLHTLGGIIHGDLHAGNVTMYTNYTGYEQKYVLASGQDINVYIQKSGEPYIGRLIDFSRAFITGRGPLTESHNQVSIRTVLEDQGSRLVRSISRAIPELFKSQEKKITEIVSAGELPDFISVIDEIYLSKALLSIFDGLEKGQVGTEFLSSRDQDKSGGESDEIRVDPIKIHKDIKEMLRDFVSGSEKYLAKMILGHESPEYFTREFLSGRHFDCMKCMKTTASDLKGFRVSETLDILGYDTGACSQNAGNRCISSTMSFGTTIREDIYMALLDAGDKFPNADKNKIRIMLDIHEKNDEWFILSEDQN